MGGIFDDMIDFYSDQYAGRIPKEEKAGTKIGGTIGSMIGSIWGPIGKMAGYMGGTHLGGNIGRLVAGEEVMPTLIDQFLTGPIFGRAGLNWGGIMGKQ